MGWTMDAVRDLELDELFTVLRMMKEGKLRKAVL